MQHIDYQKLIEREERRLSLLRAKLSLLLERIKMVENIEFWTDRVEMVELQLEALELEERIEVCLVYLGEWRKLRNQTPR